MDVGEDVCGRGVEGVSDVVHGDGDGGEGDGGEGAPSESARVLRSDGLRGGPLQIARHPIHNEISIL